MNLIKYAKMLTDSFKDKNIISKAQSLIKKK